VPETTRSTADVLAMLAEHGYTLSVKTRIETVYHKWGAQAVTYADKLKVIGPEPLPPNLRADVKTHRDELLVVACVLAPPVGWLQVLVERYRTGHEDVVHRDGWQGPYRVGLAMLAANVAAFIGQHPAYDGSRYEDLINRALRGNNRT
jgi:hypothetical protein